MSPPPWSGPVSLAAALPVVLPLLAPALAAAEALPPLYAVARALPPAALGGLECRLEAGPRPVDLHEGFRRSRGEQHALAAYLAGRREALRASPAWSALERLARWWSGAPSPSAEQVWSLGLELDSGDARDGLPTPSVFFTLGDRDGLPAACALGLVRELLDLLGRPAATTRLEEVFTACGEQAARITHVGMMLSRQTRALRLNVAGGGSTAVPALLRSVGWPGDLDALARDAGWLASAADHVVCCLDVDDAVHPHVGLECFIDEPPAASDRWRRFLDGLVVRGVCDPAKGATLRAFDRLLTPATSTVPWPDPLIVASLQHDTGALSAFRCWLHHVKLTRAPGGLAAKGYLAFAHQWLGVPPSSPPAGASTRPSPAPVGQA